jgi:putative sterol carrier protein
MKTSPVDNPPGVAPLRDRLGALADEKCDAELRDLFASPDHLGQLFADLAVQLNREAAEDGVIRFEIIDEGVSESFALVIEGTVCTVQRPGGASARLTLGLSVADFVRLIAGRLDAGAAHAAGKLSLAGDVAFAGRIGPMFDSDAAARGNAERDRFRQALRDGDPQVRLNAAVRLAYLRDAQGLDDLVTGLSNESDSVRYIQVPEALALLREAAVPRVRELASKPGPARLPAARTLVLWQQPDAAVTALKAALESGARDEHSMALRLAGELGPRASPAAEPLAAAARACSGTVGYSLSALAAVTGADALPVLLDALDTGESATRRAAMRGVAALGPAALKAAAALRSAVCGESLPLRERLDAAHALIRVGPAAEAIPALLAAISSGGRWLQIGILRQMARACPRCSVRQDAVAHWPAWEARLIHRDPVLLDSETVRSVVRALAGLIDHDDYDVRRNAALGLALCTPSPSIIDAVRGASRLDEGLRSDVLCVLGAGAGARPALDPAALALTDPAIDLDTIAAACEHLWRRADGGELDYDIPVPKWQFLQYLVERHGVMLHGSRVPDIGELRPISRSGGGGRTADQPGVFAVDHALMAIYFGVVDRTRVPSLSNAIYSLAAPDGRSRRYFRLGAEFISLAERPFIEASVYVLRRDTFTMYGEWTSLVPVKPLAWLRVRPDEFPLLEYLWGSDLAGLHAQFSADLHFLRDVGFWASRRSDRTASASLLDQSQSGTRTYA